LLDWPTSARTRRAAFVERTVKRGEASRREFGFGKRSRRLAQRVRLAIKSAERRTFWSIAGEIEGSAWVFALWLSVQVDEAFRCGQVHSREDEDVNNKGRPFPSLPYATSCTVLPPYGRTAPAAAGSTAAARATALRALRVALWSARPCMKWFDRHWRRGRYFWFCSWCPTASRTGIGETWAPSPGRGFLFGTGTGLTRRPLPYCSAGTKTKQKPCRTAAPATSPPSPFGECRGRPKVQPIQIAVQLNLR